MSDLSATAHNFEDLLSGRISFSQFEAGEMALLRQNIATAPEALQPVLSLGLSSLAAGASALVGVGQTVIGPILAETTATQVTQILNILSALGAPTAGPLSLAEQAVLTQVITGLKAGLDKAGVHIATTGAA